MTDEFNLADIYQFQSITGKGGDAVRLKKEAVPKTNF